MQGGHNVTPLAGSKRNTAIRAPATLNKPGGTVVLESYDDTDYGYLRVIVTATQLRLEYHPASDGAAAKTPDDFVTVDLAHHKLVHFTA